VLCNKVEWESSLNNSEFPLASKLIDLNGMNGLRYTSLRDIILLYPKYYFTCSVALSIVHHIEDGSIRHNDAGESL
jgi:hypothetical protein